MKTDILFIKEEARMKRYEELLIDSNMLNREVKIYIYLPEKYYDIDIKYPVVYMHDGEIIFNDFDNDESEIGILDKYSKATNIQEVVLVGIGSGKGIIRNNELCPFPIMNKRMNIVVGGKTDVYFDFIVQELMPTINQKYRTKTTPEHTGMLGISLGGMCTLYASAKLSSSFSSFAFVSSAHYRLQKEMLEFVKKEDFNNVSRLYSDVGTQESDNQEISDQFVKSNEEIYEVLETKTNIKKFKYKVINDSKHETSYWNERFTEIIDFMFG